MATATATLRRHNDDNDRIYRTYLRVAASQTRAVAAAGVGLTSCESEGTFPSHSAGCTGGLRIVSGELGVLSGRPIEVTHTARTVEGSTVTCDSALGRAEVPVRRDV